MGYAIRELVPEHLAQVRERRLKLVEKTEKAVKERLTAEIRYWDFRASELKQEEAAGKVNAKINSQMAARRADELQARLENRLAELEKGEAYLGFAATGSWRCCCDSQRFT